MQLSSPNKTKARQADSLDPTLTVPLVRPQQKIMDVSRIAARSTVSWWPTSNLLPIRPFLLQGEFEGLEMAPGNNRHLFWRPTPTKDRRLARLIWHRQPRKSHR